MNRMLAAACGLSLLVGSPGAQTIQAPFHGAYAFRSLGAISGVPTPYGGVTFLAGDPDTLLIGGAANTRAGAIYAAPVVRDGEGRITGFGAARLFATAPHIDGGITFGPGGVLFYTAYPHNLLGMIRPGSVAPDRLVDLTGLGVAVSVGALGFVPQGFPGAGTLKVASYNGDAWYQLALQTDGAGTFDVSFASGPVAVQGGPEGILYVPPGSPLFRAYRYVLVAEYRTGRVACYRVDANGDPLPATRLDFMTGLGGAEGATADPITGDLLFSTYGGGNQVAAVQGFGVCGEFRNYGSGVAGANGVPAIHGGGCAGRGQVASIAVDGGLANATGLLVAGYRQQSIPLLNGTLLNDGTQAFLHALDGRGEWSLAAPLPIDPFLSGLAVHFQAWYLDPGGHLGVSATDGLTMTVR